MQIKQEIYALGDRFTEPHLYHNIYCIYEEYTTVNFNNNS